MAPSAADVLTRRRLLGPEATPWVLCTLLLASPTLECRILTKPSQELFNYTAVFPWRQPEFLDYAVGISIQEPIKPRRVNPYLRCTIPFHQDK
jgi:hypothetical protein